jgi:hypothetical protein
VRAEHDGDAALAPAAGPLTPAVPRGMSYLIHRFRALPGTLRDALEGPWQREGQRIRAEFGAQGLLPLLMKPRNGTGWTRDERIQLWHHLRQVASLSPYLLVLLAPGSLVLLPVVAWWLDRRRVLRAHIRLNSASGKPPVM